MMSSAERLQADYRGTDLTTGPHPMALVRAQFPDLWRAIDLPQARSGAIVRIGGAVICRQRPGTAKGFVFISVEDETGVANAVVEPAFFEAHRLTITHEPFLLIEGRLQNIESVIHIRATRVEPLLARPLVEMASHDFH
jgi:error-prone DNA polymerase